MASDLQTPLHVWRSGVYFSNATANIQKLRSFVNATADYVPMAFAHRMLCKWRLVILMSVRIFSTGVDVWVMSFLRVAVASR